MTSQDDSAWRHVIGSPATVNLRLDGSVWIVGRITDRDGGVTEVTTPHGTPYRAGFLWVRKPNEEQLEYLAELENGLKADESRTCSSL